MIVWNRKNHISSAFLLFILIFAANHSLQVKQERICSSVRMKRSVSADYVKEVENHFKYESESIAKLQGNLSQMSTAHDLRYPKSVYGNETAASMKEIPIRNKTVNILMDKNSSTIDQFSSTTTTINKGRQNSDHDIKDIITGIVKLLNGNVNVHANTQIHRKPITSRINNRGPPRISETQDYETINYDQQKPTLGSSMRPPPYSFDHPDRPFITGVPIPEQIVPYRPGYVINHPPWHRNRPRPPIIKNDVSRRPIMLYKPLPTQHYQQNLGSMSEQDEKTLASPSPITMQSYKNEESKVDSTFFNERNESWNLSNPSKLEEKQKIEQNDSFEKFQIEIGDRYPVTKNTSSVFSGVEKEETQSVNKTPVSEHIAELTESSATISSPTYINTHTTMISGIDLDPSTEDIIFMTTSRTPSLTLTDNQRTKLPAISVNPLKYDNITSLPPTVNRTINQNSPTSNHFSVNSSTSYHPRPGIVLDDPEFRPGGHGTLQTQTYNTRKNPTQYHHLNHTNQQYPPRYGEIFDVTLSAIQGLSSGDAKSQKTVKVRPYGLDNTENENDILLIPSNNESFVSIDGKRTYINLLGGESSKREGSILLDTTTTISVPMNKTDTSYNENFTAINETKKVDSKASNSKSRLGQLVTANHEFSQPFYRQRTTQHPVRIDTCIVGDDSTCDQAQHERCQTENGISSCHCRPGYSRRKHREPCRKIISFYLTLRVDRIYDRNIVWDNKLLDPNSEQYGQLGFESVMAIDSAMSMTPYSDEFMEAKVNNFYKREKSQENVEVIVNLTLKFDEGVESLRPNMRSDVQKHLLGVIHRRNNNIGSSRLFVNSPEGSISQLQDINECQSDNLNDCNINALCWNSWGTFQCVCKSGFRDPWADQPFRAGRDCQTCSDSYCNNHGTCSYNDAGMQVCACNSSYYGGQCEIDGEVLGVAIGASIAAVIIIVLTLICLIMWSRKWQREQKNAIGSPMFGYMNTTPLKCAPIPQNGYHVTLEDRMRWAQIADVIAQTNHYGAEPVSSTRPSSAIFTYPNLQSVGLGTMGGVPVQANMQMHHTEGLPPVPLPRRLGLSPCSNGMRTLENSSSSEEEEDRTDLLARNFQVPRPKSRSNGSITNQSGIYYDVDYLPSGVGAASGEMLYGSQNHQGTSPTYSNQHHHVSVSQGIPMSTYTSGRAPSSYYVK